MKKCASCTKDLPDAALHCVFCGAKQAPSPASQPVVARTVMGYGANEELNQLREQAAAANAARSHTQSQPPPTSGYAPGNLAPIAGPNAATMFTDRPPAAAVAAAAAQVRPHSPSQSPPINPSAGAYHVGPPAPYAAPFASTAVQQPPYVAPGKLVQAGRPIEPFKDSLRTQMFVWGVLLLVAFGVPLTLEPLTGLWDVVLHGTGAAKLVPLILVAVGFLSVAIGAIPMEAGARGLIATLLGLAGIVVPIVLAITTGPEGDVARVTDWHSFVPMLGMLLLVPGLLLRSAYRDSLAPRILVTVGVLASLVAYLVPVGDTIPLVAAIQGAFSGETDLKSILAFVAFVLPLVWLVLSLLVWLPGPSTAGAKTLAWLFLLYPLLIQAVQLFLAGDPSNITETPNAALVAWIGQSAYLALFSYGVATVVGKQLE